MIFNSTVSVKRLQPDDLDADKEGYVTNQALTAVPVHIQPASPEHTVLIEGVFGQTYRMYTTHSGILNGDHVTDNLTNVSYVVKGRENWDFEPLPHYEMTLVELEQ